MLWQNLQEGYHYNTTGLLNDGYYLSVVYLLFHCWQIHCLMGSLQSQLLPLQSSLSFFFCSWFIIFGKFSLKVVNIFCFYSVLFRTPFHPSPKGEGVHPHDLL